MKSNPDEIARYDRGGLDYEHLTGGWYIHAWVVRADDTRASLGTFPAGFGCPSKAAARRYVPMARRALLAAIREAA